MTGPARQPSPTAGARSGRAFTLVELLVVVAVIGILMGALLPALGGAQRRAAEVRDMGAARQVALAYAAYAADNEDDLIVGMYKVAPPGRIDDTFGGDVTGLPKQRYPWRLISFLDAGVRGTIFVGSEDELLADVPEPGTTARGAWQYRLSVFPSFGVNGHFLGGYQPDARPDLPFRVTTRMSQIRQPSRMIAFGSTRGEDWDGTGIVRSAGWYLIESPAWGLTGPFGGGFGRWSDETYTEASHPESFGNVDARYSGRILTAMPDGHAEFETPEELRDMTRWSDDAARAGDADWDPREVPAG